MTDSPSGHDGRLRPAPPGDVLVVGSVAYDTVQTAAGRREDALGGSGAYFSVAGSYFTAVGLVAVVGDDFDPAHTELLKSRGIDLSGLETKPGSTFRWSGVYGAEDVNTRDTLDTQLNVFADFDPRLIDAHRTQSYLFLANIDPNLQMSVLDQMAERPRLVALDTMNFWIDGSREALRQVVGSVDVLFMDESEVRSFSGEASLLAAARRIMDMGPAVVVVKRGEHGVLLVQESGLFAAPAYPVEGVVDPTGAGDCFAGGFVGYLAATGDLSPSGFRRAAIVGTVMGSFAVESFSLDRVNSLERDDIEGRFRTLTDITVFAPLCEGESLPGPRGR